MATIRFLLLNAGWLVCAAPLCAQVFPGLGLSDAAGAVREAERRPSGQPDDASSKPPNPESTEPKPPAPRDYAKGFADAVKGVKDERMRCESAWSALKSSMRREAKPFLDAEFDAAVEKFKDAARGYGKLSPGDPPKDAPAALAEIIKDVRNGSAWNQSIRCEVMGGFNLNARDAATVGKDAERAAAAARKRLADMLKTGERGGYNMNALESINTTIGEKWLSFLAANWRETHDAWQRASANPGDFDAVYNFAKAAEGKFVTLTMHRRQTLKYLIEYFPEHPQVRGGELAAHLARSYEKTFQYDDAQSIIAATLRDLRDGRERRELERTRNWIGEQRDRFQRSYLNN